jgi:hypothetical protein
VGPTDCRAGGSGSRALKVACTQRNHIWFFRALLQTTDCGAISNMYTANHYAVDYANASADALNAGTDLSTEAAFAGGALASALAANLTTVSQARVPLLVTVW